MTQLERKQWQKTKRWILIITYSHNRRLLISTIINQSLTIQWLDEMKAKFPFTCGTISKEPWWQDPDGFETRTAPKTWQRFGFFFIVRPGRWRDWNIDGNTPSAHRTSLFWHVGYFLGLAWQSELVRSSKTTSWMTNSIGRLVSFCLLGPPPLPASASAENCPALWPAFVFSFLVMAALSCKSRHRQGGRGKFKGKVANTRAPWTDMEAGAASVSCGLSVRFYL